MLYKNVRVHTRLLTIVVVTGPEVEEDAAGARHFTFVNGMLFDNEVY